ncbi:Alpha/Beta hydrolase protein [Cristinia sonorae]|uniref:Alpha/Beta hydrolase protein n=1 Tax=Cristinia sonorae TaxID=1940300 RepID=A0A8K0UYJ0_9AGAR|nr:Alpha/Beta hydrolase protein [Cristinia sonorae]
MIHGVSAPSLVFKHIVEELVKAGFRVLLYDIYGRGYSEAPKYTLSTEDYATQLALLMQHIAWSSTYVVGLSMGGGIASAFVATFPHLVNSKIVLIASAGLLDPGHFRRWNHEERNAQSQDAGVCAAKPPSYDKELKKV